MRKFLLTLVAAILPIFVYSQESVIRIETEYTKETISKAPNNDRKVKPFAPVVLVWEGKQKPKWNWTSGKELITFADEAFYKLSGIKEDPKKLIFVMRPGQAEAKIVVYIRGTTEDEDTVQEYAIRLTAEGGEVTPPGPVNPPAPNSPLAKQFADAWAKDKAAGKARPEVVKLLADLFKSVPEGAFANADTGKKAFDQIIASSEQLAKQRGIVYDLNDCREVRTVIQSEWLKVAPNEGVISVDARRLLPSTLKAIGAELEQLK